MNRILATIALAASLASPALAQPDLRYYNTVPSSHAPAITGDPSPRGFAAGDYVVRQPDLRMDSELLRVAPGNG